MFAFLGGGENDKKDLFFDLDGTLIDKVDFSELVKRKLKEFNYQYTDTQFRQYMQAMQKL